MARFAAITKEKTAVKPKIFPLLPDEIIISQESVAAFKEWMGS
jgi:hypothetical protein